MTASILLPLIAARPVLLDSVFDSTSPPSSQSQTILSSFIMLWSSATLVVTLPPPPSLVLQLHLDPVQGLVLHVQLIHLSQKHLLFSGQSHKLLLTSLHLPTAFSQQFPQVTNLPLQDDVFILPRGHLLGTVAENDHFCSHFSGSLGVIILFP